MLAIEQGLLQPVQMARDCHGRPFQPESAVWHLWIERHIDFVPRSVRRCICVPALHGSHRPMDAFSH